MFHKIAQKGENDVRQVETKTSLALSKIAGKISHEFRGDRGFPKTPPTLEAKGVKPSEI